jgi:glycosyl transferase family 87
MATVLTDAARPIASFGDALGRGVWSIAEVLRRYGLPLRHGLVLAGLLFAGYLFAITAPVAGTVGFDAFAYWSVDLHDLYGNASGAGGDLLGAFRYSPAAAQLFTPFALLPFWQFLWLWLALLVGTIVWLGGRRTLLLLAFPPIALELYHANIHLLLAAAIVLGFRYPVAWSFVLLTKVTPGIGLLWFAVRREWHSLGIALVATAIVAGVSAAVAPGLWLDWVASLTRTSDLDTAGHAALAIPLLVRLPIAALIVVWGARTDRRWTVVVAATVAMPVLWPTAFATLAGVVPRWRKASEERAQRMRRTPLAIAAFPIG